VGTTVIPYLADVFVLLGVFVMTIGVYGVIRLPDTYTKMHAASKVVVLGVISLLVASTVTVEAEFILRAILIAAFLLLTTPVASHAIARAAYLRGEKMQAPEAVDETGRGLAARGRAGRDRGTEHPG
jgi:multicomponent Na+:H+ antiporter subunit G